MAGSTINPINCTGMPNGFAFFGCKAGHVCRGNTAEYIECGPDEAFNEQSGSCTKWVRHYSRTGGFIFTIWSSFGFSCWTLSRKWGNCYWPGTSIVIRDRYFKAVITHLDLYTIEKVSMEMSGFWEYGDKNCHLSQSHYWRQGKEWKIYHSEAKVFWQQADGRGISPGPARCPPTTVLK